MRLLHNSWLLGDQMSSEWTNGVNHCSLRGRVESGYLLPQSDILSLEGFVTGCAPPLSTAFPTGNHKMVILIHPLVPVAISASVQDTACPVHDNGPGRE
jgi:hypothetical protein